MSASCCIMHKIKKTKIWNQQIDHHFDSSTKGYRNIWWETRSHLEIHNWQLNKWVQKPTKVIDRSVL